MFAKTIIQQDKQIKDLQKENNFLYQENKENRSTIEDLEYYKMHSSIVHKDIEKELLELQNINHLGISEENKNMQRNQIINNIIKELADCESN